MHLKHLVLLLVLFSTGGSLFSQNHAEVSGKVLDPEGNNLAYANLILYNSIDSNAVKVNVTGEAGEFLFRGIAAGGYRLEISFVGLPTLKHAFFLNEGEQKVLDPLQMLPSEGTTLEQVVVKAQRPLLELKHDKMIFNVENSINAVGSNGLELLKLSPGVMVDNNRNITILGRTGVRIFIDGRPTPMRGEDLANYLETIQSTDIDAIEIITNPGSKYEAEGNAGIINIRLKKDKNLGGNGTLNLGYQAAKYHGIIGGISGNYRSKKLNFFGSYSYNERKNRGYITGIEELGQFRKDTDDTWINERGGHTAKAGVDYFLSARHTLGVMMDLGINNRMNENRNRFLLGPTGSAVVDSILLAFRDLNGDNTNLNLNLNYLYNIGKDQELSLDINYGRFNSGQNEFQPNAFVDPTETEVFSELINDIDRSRSINLYTLRADYERSLGEGTLGAGMKFSYVTTDNQFGFYNQIAGERIVNVDRTNDFLYEEQINAAYLNYSAKISQQLNYELGLRAEQTLSTGELTALKATENDLVKRSYINLFPSASLNFKPSDKHSFQLSYSRRINRPAYNNLNPFESKSTELTGFRGNPFLRPEYSNTFQIRHSFDLKFNTTIVYSQTKDIMLRQTEAGEGNISHITWLNLADQSNYSINLAAPFSITKWWSSFTSLTAYYRQNKGDFGDGKSINAIARAWNAYGQETFKVGKSLSLELSGWYNSKTVWGGNLELDPRWGINAGFSLKLLRGQGNLRFTVNDVFNSVNFHVRSTFGILRIDAYGDFNADRWFNTNFTYTFGNNKVKKARRRETGSEDERQRMGNTE